MKRHRGLRPATPPTDAPVRFATHGADYTCDPAPGIYVTRSMRWVLWDSHYERSMERSGSREFATLAAAQRHVRALNNRFGEKTSVEPRAQFLPEAVDVPCDTPPGAYYDTETGVYLTFLWRRRVNEPRAVVARTADDALAMHLAKGTVVGRALKTLEALEQLQARVVFNRLMAQERHLAALIELGQLIEAAGGEELDETDPQVASLLAILGGAP